MLSANTRARRWQWAAVALMLAAAAAWALALQAASRAIEVLGPSALLTTAAGEVWIGVDDRLWRASAQGTLRHDDALAALGLPRAPANLVQAPDGRIVATVRDDATLYLLDPLSAKVTGTLQPQWPADIARHGGRAINLAFHADGRFAIATGGGHLVALFGPQGAFLGRTAPETYRYTNGLWWQGDALWTTDTNRFLLKRLDPTTLAVAATLTLPEGTGGRFLGPARGRPGNDGPMAALVRFENGMTLGRVAVVARDGRETRLAHPTFEPRDLAWLGDEIIATDGLTRRVLRWGADGSARPPFGDDALRERLQDGGRQRDADQQRARWLRVLAAALCLAALAAALQARRVEGRARDALAPLDLSRLGTPQLPPAELTRRQLQVFGPWGWLLLPLGLFQAVSGLVPRGVPGAVAALLALCAAGALVAWLGWRHRRRLMQSPRCEPVFNHFAMQRLAGEDTLRAALREGEWVLETFMWARPPRLRWTVLTSERLLQFRNGFGGWKLETALARGSIAKARLKGDRLALQLADGSLLKGRVTALTVAQRVAQALGAPGRTGGPA